MIKNVKIVNTYIKCKGATWGFSLGGIDGLLVSNCIVDGTNTVNGVLSFESGNIKTINANVNNCLFILPDTANGASKISAASARLGDIVFNSCKFIGKSLGANNLVFYSCILELSGNKEQFGGCTFDSCKITNQQVSNSFIYRNCRLQKCSIKHSGGWFAQMMVASGETYTPWLLMQNCEVDIVDSEYFSKWNGSGFSLKYIGNVFRGKVRADWLNAENIFYNNIFSVDPKFRTDGGAVPVGAETNKVIAGI